MRTLDNINKFLVEKLGQKAQPTLLDAFNALSRAYGGEGKARSKQKALEELEKVFIGPEEGLVLISAPANLKRPWIYSGLYDYYEEEGCPTLIRAAKLHELEGVKLKSCKKLFKFWSNAEEIDFSKIDTSEVTDMSEMFMGCKALKKINASILNTSKVTNMAFMFAGTSAEIDLSNFDTSEVTNMGYMFAGYTGASLDLSNFDTSEVTNMRDMFTGAENLTSINLSSFDTSKVKYMRDMFAVSGTGDRIKYANLSSFDTANVTDLDYEIGLSNVETVIFPGEGKWASNKNVSEQKWTSHYLSVASVQSLVTALASKTDMSTPATLTLYVDVWAAAKAADPTLETTLTTKNWEVKTRSN